MTSWTAGLEYRHAVEAAETGRVAEQHTVSYERDILRRVVVFLLSKCISKSTAVAPGEGRGREKLVLNFEGVYLERLPERAIHCYPLPALAV